MARRAILAASLLAAGSAAQAGGFTAGDLFVYTGAIATPHQNGIVRVNPLTGASSVLVDLYTVQDRQGSAAFDPYRQRLFFMGKADPGALTWWRAYLIDGTGQLTPFGYDNVSWDGISPTGDGRIYFHDQLSGSQPLRWFDAANQLHVLYDLDGVTPLTLNGLAIYIEGMIYHAGENALFTVQSVPYAPCPGGNASRLHVRKLPLSADGTRLAAPMVCAEFDVNPNDLEVSCGFALLPDGDLLLGAHNGLYNTPLPRLIRVDRATASMTTWASFGDASNGGTAFSSVLNRAIAQNHFTGQLLTYTQNQVDHGVPVPGGYPFPSTRCVITEIPARTCSGAWIAYGSGLMGSGNVVPRLYGAQCARVGSPFTVKADQVVGAGSGLLLIGTAAAAVPLLGGTLYVSPILTAPVTAGGAAGSPGAGSLDLPIFLGDPSLVGASLFLQAAFLDTGATQLVSLTNGLQVVIG